MKTIVAFFEIPSVDFNRAIHFYESTLNVKLTPIDCGDEKMAFFPEENGQCPGAISFVADNKFLPSRDGVLISLTVESIEKATESISKLGGKTLIPKTKIERLENILPSGITGTTTTFYPDPEIFKETTEFDNKIIIKSLKDRAYLTSKIYFHFYLHQ